MSEPVIETQGQLAEIQRRMAAAVMHPLTRAETMPRRRRNGVSNQAEAEAIIRPNDRLTSFERLEIYNRQYWFRLYTCFEEDFPGLQAILGRAKFDALMRAYLTDCPSESFSLRNLASRLDTWLEQHPADYLTLSKMLWHSNINTTIQIYGSRFNESSGVRAMEAWLDERSRESS